MIAMFCSMSIISGHIGEKMCWFSAHMHELAKYNWENRHMSNQFDVLEQALLGALDEPSLLTYEDFTMNIFNEVVDAMPEFAEFKQCKYDEKTQR